MAFLLADGNCISGLCCFDCVYNIKEAYYYIMNHLKISELTSLLISKLRSEPEILFPMREKTL